mmetsp:Transcript_23689/g.65847  ORF Transcript_23689/g.65847 Transcript_23689/m.65847 type:complete len:129 (+) Transcript_23689:528-914(+)
MFFGVFFLPRRNRFKEGRYFLRRCCCCGLDDANANADTAPTGRDCTDDAAREEATEESSPPPDGSNNKDWVTAAGGGGAGGGGDCLLLLLLLLLLPPLRGKRRLRKLGFLRGFLEDEKEEATEIEDER